MLRLKYPKKFLALSLSLILAVSLAACGGNTDGAPVAGSDKKELKEIRMGYLTVMDDAQAMLAYDAGLYEKHGLKVTMHEFASGTDLIKQIIGGQLDAGVSDLPMLYLGQPKVLISKWSAVRKWDSIV